MSQPARVSIEASEMEQRNADRPYTMRVGVLRSRNQASFCLIRNVTRQHVQVEVFSNIREAEWVSLRAGDGEVVTGTIASCTKGLATIDLDHRLDAEAFRGMSAHNDPDRRRSLPRVDAAARVRVKSNRKTIASRLHNISVSGAKISASGTFLPGAPIVLTLPDFGDLRGFVCWSNTREAGIRFEAHIPVEALAAWLSDRTRVSYEDWHRPFARLPCPPGRGIRK